MGVGASQFGGQLVWGVRLFWFRVQPVWSAGPLWFGVWSFWGVWLVHGTDPSYFGHSWTGVHGWFGMQVSPNSGDSWFGVHSWLRVQVPPDLGTAGLGFTAGSGHRSLLVWAQLDWGAQLVQVQLDRDSQLVWGADSSRFRVQPVWDAGPAQFRTGAGCGSLSIQHWSRIRDAGPSQFGIQVPSSSQPVRDAGPSQFNVQLFQDVNSSQFRTREGCRFFPVRDAGASQFRAGMGGGMRIPPVLGCSLLGVQVPPGSGRSRFGVLVPRGSGRSRSGVRVPPGSGCSRFEMWVPPGSGRSQFGVRIPPARHRSGFAVQPVPRSRLRRVRHDRGFYERLGRCQRAMGRAGTERPPLVPPGPLPLSAPRSPPSPSRSSQLVEPPGFPAPPIFTPPHPFSNPFAL